MESSMEATIDQDLMSRIDAIDLRMVALKLQDPEEGKGWSSEYIQGVEREYRRYLYLLGVGVAAVPTLEVDAMWHQHILDTRAYAQDCQRVFGRFMHHFPYLGLRGPEDAMLLERMFRETQQVHQALFGESVVPTAHCGRPRPGYCNSPGRCSEAGCIGSCSRLDPVGA